MSLLFLYTGRTRNAEPQGEETTRFLPVSTENMVGFTESPVSPYHDYRWAGDTAHNAERSFSGTTQNSRDISPDNDHRFPKEQPPRADADDDHEEEDGLPMPMPMPAPQRRSIFLVKRIDSFLLKRVPGLFSARLLKAAEVIYEVLDRTILILGFIALVSGGVTYFGIFVSTPRHRQG